MGAFLVSTMSPCTILMSGAAVELRPPLWKGWPQAVVDTCGCDYKAWNPGAFPGRVAHLELKFHLGHAMQPAGALASPPMEHMGNV